MEDVRTMLMSFREAMEKSGEFEEKTPQPVCGLDVEPADGRSKNTLSQ
ncbi:MAG: hypothetical protein LRY51_04025 [Geovibrio sp.]|nr:hypothetical protein [Geovibrio sp.]